jgi:hypothetical protein
MAAPSPSTEPARLAALVTLALQVLTAAGLVAFTDADAVKVGTVVAVNAPIVWAAFAWVRRRVWTRQSVAELLRSEPPAR